MTRFLSFVDGDPLMSELDHNEVLPDVEVAAPVRENLESLRAVLK